MTDKAELLGMIGRIRRLMPRQGEVMAICEELERRLLEAKVEPKPDRNKFDKRTWQRGYMREYMRLLRAKRRQR